MELRASPREEDEIVEEMNLRAVAETVEEKVYVALGKDVKKGKSYLLWALQLFRRSIVIIHVHRPAKMIPMLGGKFPASQLDEVEVQAFRRLEREKMKKSVDDYLLLCSKFKVSSEKLVVETDDIAKGLVDLIAQYRITKLVMGTTGKHFLRKMKAPMSKIAIYVAQNADPSCHIWFVCKGNLIYTRETDISCGLLLSQGCSPNSESTSTSLCGHQQLSRSLAQGMRGNSIILGPLGQVFWNNTSSGILGFHEVGTPTGITRPSRVKTSSPESCCSFGRSIGAPSSEKLSQRSPKSSCCSSSSAYDEEALRTPEFESVEKDEESGAGLMLDCRLHASDENSNFLSQPHPLEDGGADAELHQKLKDALSEAERIKHEAYEESLSRQRAEREAAEAIYRAKGLENFYVNEVYLRKEVEEALGRSKLEIEKLINQQDEVYEELHKTNEKKLQLEMHIADSDGRVKDLEEKLMVSCSLLNSLQSEHVLLRRRLDRAVREAEELRRKKERVPTTMDGYANLSVFSFSEIERATCSFSHSRKIGEGSSGIVYKGFLRNTTVAIKTLKPISMRARSEFNQEVSLIGRTRHPNLVSLMGVCPDASALVYEYLPSGNLEDRLACDSSTPLTWQARTRIVTEICSALIFLHSSRPHPVVHGDLKPENILLDSNLVSKLGDFGLSHFVIQPDATAAHHHEAHPNNAFAYVDPEFLLTGDLAPCSDVYSFGVITLRLLTGMPAVGVIGKVQEAVEKDVLQQIIDPAAGNWPLGYAKRLASVGLRCCETSRKNRPDLVSAVWKELELMLKAAAFLLPSSSTDDNSCIPSYFICPIFQEVMKDPCIAADGFTYEGEALRGWIDSGHDTSPMTNLKLPHREIVPNRALRSAIHEWLQHQ